MSTINIAELSPKVREAFLLTEPAITAWDVSAHKVLEDCVQNGKRVQVDITKRKVIGEILLGVLIALTLDLLPLEFMYLFRADNSIFAAKVRLYGVIFIIISNIWVAVHRKRKILRLKQEGAEWRTNINRLIELTNSLSHDERQQLYAVMLALGLEVQQGKRNVAMMQASYNEGWRDGFFIGDD